MDKMQQHEEAGVALESFIDDLRFVARDGRGQDPMETAIAARRWDNLAVRYGFEALNEDDTYVDIAFALAVGAGRVVKKAFVASAHHFGNFVGSVQEYLDKSGGKAVDRLRQQIEDVPGDGGSVVLTDKSLATSLAVNGRLPSDFGQEVTKLTGLVDTLEKAVKAVRQVAKDAGAHSHTPNIPKTEKEFRALLQGMTAPVVRSGSPALHFPSAMLTEQFLGGQRVCVEKAQRPVPPKGLDGDSRKLAEIVSTLKYSIASHKPAQEAANPRVPVLSRHQARDMVEHCEKLTDGLHRLLTLAKETRSYPDSLEVGGDLEFLIGEVNADEMELTDADRLQISWLELYYRDDLASHRRLIEAGLRIVGTAHKAMTGYIETSLKHYK